MESKECLHKQGDVVNLSGKQWQSSCSNAYFFLMFDDSSVRYDCSNDRQTFCCDFATKAVHTLNNSRD